MAIAFYKALANQATSFTYSQENANEMIFFITEKGSGAITISVGGNAATEVVGSPATIGAGTQSRLFYYFSAVAGTHAVTSTGAPDSIGVAAYTGMDANSIVAVTVESNIGPQGGNYVKAVTQTLSGGWQISVVMTDAGTPNSQSGNFTARAANENQEIFDTNGVIGTGSYTGTYNSSSVGSRQYCSFVVEVRAGVTASTEVAGTPVDGFLATFTAPTLSEVSGTPVDGVKKASIPANVGKSSTTVTNVQKS